MDELKINSSELSLAELAELGLHCNRGRSELLTGLCMGSIRTGFVMTITKEAEERWQTIINSQTVNH